MSDKTTKPLMSITKVSCTCVCGWQGTVYDCEPDIDGDGSLGCPECGKVINVQMPLTTTIVGWHITLTPGGHGLIVEAPDGKTINLLSPQFGVSPDGKRLEVRVK